LAQAVGAAGLLTELLTAVQKALVPLRFPSCRRQTSSDSVVNPQELFVQAAAFRRLESRRETAGFTDMVLRRSALHDRPTRPLQSKTEQNNVHSAVFHGAPSFL